MKQPKTTRYCLGFAIAGWGAALVAHAVTTTDFTRYQGILDRKPFGEVAPIVVPGTGTTDLVTAESFIKDYEMKAIIDDGDKIQVCLLDKKANKHIYLDIGQEVSGMQLVSVNYDKEEAVLKMGIETTIIKLHPDKDKDKGAAPAMAGALGVPAFGMPRKNLAAENAASPFSPNDQGGDSRWVHRPVRDLARWAQRDDPSTAPGRIYAGLRHLIALRQHLPSLAGGRLSAFWTKNHSVLGYLRSGEGQGGGGNILVLGNFSEHPQAIDAAVMLGMPASAVDLIGQAAFNLRTGFTLAPYQMVWLDCRGA